MTDQEALATWVQAYAAEAGRDENVEAFVDAVNAAIVADLPELGADAVLLADLHASTRSQFQVFLSLLEREKQELLLPPQAIDLAVSIARRQMDLGVLLKVYRVAAAAVWDWFTHVAASVPDDGPDRTDVLVYLWDHGGTWINEAIEQLIGVFHAEREAGVQGAVARRIETVRAVVRGEGSSVDEVSSALAHPIRGWHTGVVLWTDQASEAAAVSLSQRAATLAASIGARSLAVPVSGREIWCWLTTNRAPDLAALRSAAEAADPVVRAAVGVPGADLAGFRTTHREAVDTQQHAEAVGSRAVTLFGDVELACLAAGNPDAARELVRRELGDLAADDEALARVRETVATYLRLGANVEQTATELIVHKNTVRYRLSQAEDLLGRPLASRRTELAVALHCLQRFGTS